MDHQQAPSDRAHMPQTKESGTANVAALYRLFVESVTDYAIILLDETGHVRSWNPGAQRLKGYTSDEIIGKYLGVFYPAEERARGMPERELRTARETGRFEDEGWRVRKDGTWFWANVVLTTLRDPTGTIIGFAKITRDLTQRREAEEQARALAAEQAARAEAQKRGAELSELNEQLQQQTAELEAQTEEAQSLTEELEQSNADLQETNEALRRALDASSFLAEAARVLGASLDYERTLRSVAHSCVPRLGDWCAVDVIVDPERHEWPPRVERLAVVHQDPRKVKWAEELAEKVPTDWSAPTGLPRVLREGVTEFYPSITDDLLVRSARTEEELAAMRQVGFSSVIVVPLIARGMTLGALTLVQSESGRHYDAEDRALAEAVGQRAAIAVDNARLFRQAERARAEAEEANRAKSQFLARMSHELRTPLNAIGGYAELLEMGLHGALNEQQLDSVRRIQRSGRTLLALIDDVLSFARLESGRVSYRFTRVAVNDVLASVEPLVRPQLRDKGLAYEYVPVDPAVTVWADPEKVEQIVLNLLTNAIKFTEHGKITVRAESREHQVLIQVSDTGVGISPEKLQVIFDPFVQGEPALTRTSHGSGLGLAISRELARAMGGDVYVESVVGEGSTFTVALPREEGGGRREA